MTPSNDLAPLHDIALFVEVARKGNFSRAGASLAVPIATLSRRIAALERRLGVRLFDRTTRRVELTEPARRYFERCARLVDEARVAQEMLLESTNRAAGLVRVSMPVDLGVHWIAPLLPSFARAYPGIELELDLSARYADLIGENVDVALRMGAVRGEQLITRRIGAVGQALFAAASYFERQHARPKRPADLAHHDCLHIATPRRVARWRLVRIGATREVVEITVRGRITLNNVGLMRVLAEQGMGIAMLPVELARSSLNEDRLERLLPDWAPPPLPVSAVMSSRLQPAAVRAFVDFVAARLAQAGAL